MPPACDPSNNGTVRFLKRFWDPIAEGDITVAIRRWDQPRVIAGRRYRTAGTILEVDSVEIIDERSIDDEIARQAGHESAAELIRELPSRPNAPTFLVRFHVAEGLDPRELLASNNQLSEEEMSDIRLRLARLDRASTHGPWTLAVLEKIAANPGRRAPDLAAEFGRDTLPFKIDVRKLKNLGLTISLPIGYELSPRGEAYLARESPELGENF